MYHNKNIRLASSADIQQLIVLINSAYRTPGGWATESGIVRGDRIGQDQLQSLLKSEDFQLFVLEIGHHLLGCIGLTFVKDTVQVGNFAITPQ